MVYCKQLRLVVAREQGKQKVWLEYESKSRINVYPCESVQAGLDWLGRFESGVEEWVTDEPEGKKKDRIVNQALC